MTNTVRKDSASWTQAFGATQAAEEEFARAFDATRTVGKIGYDGTLPNGVRYEIKVDNVATKYGNFIFEFLSANRPSGLSLVEDLNIKMWVIKADRWYFFDPTYLGMEALYGKVRANNVANLDVTRTSRAFKKIGLTIKTLPANEGHGTNFVITFPMADAARLGLIAVLDDLTPDSVEQFWRAIKLRTIRYDRKQKKLALGKMQRPKLLVQ